MTVRSRLLIVTILGLALTMAIWGWIQLKALDRILTEQQIKRLYDMAETANTYYQHFPTGQGLSALDSTLKDMVQSDIRLARIDIFAIEKNDADYIAGASRLQYDWPENLVLAASNKGAPAYTRLNTDKGPALGILYPFPSERGDTQVVIGVISFSQSRVEILASARFLLMISSAGLLLAIVAVLALSYRWIIGRPLSIIIETIDASQTKQRVKRIPLSRRDEWGHLADHFNLMADEIEQVLAKNEELTGQLQEKVNEATHRVVQLQNQVNQLQQLTALGYLTATFAHDMGTPLHSISGMAQLLLERDDWPADVRRKLELIVQQAQRLHTVIQNVRRATRPPEPHFEAIPVENLLQETLTLVEPLMQKSAIHIDVKAGNDIPVLYVDRYRVQTALFNLIQNAQEVLPDGGRITVAADLKQDSRMVAITVSDNGPGIPQELLDKVREPFFSTHKEEGMRGLGLAIVQDIVKVHGGHFEIKSGDDGGTDVTLYFPVVDPTPVNAQL
jgi:two-component system, NtrC family, sensor kinase